jgi:hypothetical protein
MPTQQNKKDLFFLSFPRSCLLITLAFVLHLDLQLWVVEQRDSVLDP